MHPWTNEDDMVQVDVPARLGSKREARVAKQSHAGCTAD